MVGSFVNKRETADAIYEALSVLPSWKPSGVRPISCMVDYSEEEMSGIAKIFPGN